MNNKKILIFVQSLIWTTISGVNFNITNMSNCVDVPLDYKNDAEVEIMNMEYIKNSEGFADTVSGEFHVHVYRDHEETELVMWFFKCAPGATGLCEENMTSFTEALDCKRFLKDDTGPWHMFAPAIDKRNVCAELVGRYKITKAKLEGRYLEKYMTVEAGHYRIKALYHLPGKDFSVRNLRGCIESDFDIYV